MTNEKKNELGQPSKLTPRRKDIIIAAIRVGATYKIAAQAAGITYRTFRYWMEEGERQAEQESGDEYFHFFHAVKEAEGIAACQWLQIIDKASNLHWQAAAWKLERRYPQEYGKSVQEIQGKDGGPIEFEQLKSLSPEERDSRVTEILNKARERRTSENSSGRSDDSETMASTSGATEPSA